MAAVIWLTGISGSGKTTLGLGLKHELQKKYKRVEFLDGDNVRNFFESDLGYSKKERIMNVKRIAFAAMIASRNGTIVIVANIAPYYEVRDFIRKHIKEYIQIYLKASIDTVTKRDTKKHYARYRSGEMKNVVGLDDPYDIPRNPDLTVDTDRDTAAESLSKIMDFMRKKGIA